MSYTIETKRSSMKYIKEKQHEIKLRYKKDEFEKDILPAIQKSGLPVATYIKLAVAEKIRADENERMELQELLEKVKTITVEEIPKIFQDDCRQIILYGSYARGDYTRDSDFDIAILTDSDRIEAKKYDDQLDDIAVKISGDTMAIVNYVCLPYQEYEEKKSWYPYFMSIAKDGVVLYER